MPKGKVCRFGENLKTLPKKLYQRKLNLNKNENTKKALPLHKQATEKISNLFGQTSKSESKTVLEQTQTSLFGTLPPSPEPHQRSECDSKFRRLPFRFLGYGMAVGECVRYLPASELSMAVDVCGGVAVCFAACHVACVLWEDRKELEGVDKFLSTAVWEALATLTPAVVVYGVATLTWMACVVISPVPFTSQAVPCAVGLLTCLVIQRPCDRLVDQAVHVIFNELLDDW